MTNFTPEMRAQLEAHWSSSRPCPVRDAIRALLAAYDKLATPASTEATPDSAWLERQLADGIDDAISAGGPWPDSCLCCGRIGDRAVWSMKHPKIYVCRVCKDASAERRAEEGTDQSAADPTRAALVAEIDAKQLITSEEVQKEIHGLRTGCD